jgi:hypothetical protein
MLAAAGGGGYGGTDWMSMDVVQMWQAVENQDTTAHYELLTGWQRSYELTGDHLSQVQNYRDSLAAAWPPDKSAASAAYLQRLDGLIKSLQATYDTAITNHSAFASATLALGLSRNDVKKIYDEYTANQTKLAEYKSQQPTPGTPTPTPSPTPQKPPVPTGRQEELNNQARNIMYGLSGEILEAQAKITQPPAYVPEGVAGNDSHDDGGAGYVPPPIPPVTPYDPGSHHGSSSGSGQSGSTSSSSPSTQAPGQSSPPPREPGLVLGGVGPSPTPPGLPPSGTGTPPFGGGGPPPTTTVPTPVVPVPPTRSGPFGLPPEGGPSTGIGTPKGFPGEGLGRPMAGGMPEGGMRAMPVGGVIGGSPRAGLGQPAPGGRMTSRVNPVGGVINPSESEGRPGSAGRMGAPGQQIGNVGGRGGRRDEKDGDVGHWDPDNPWETAEGVAPVVLPANEQRVDPGPAIGLR